MQVSKYLCIIYVESKILHAFLVQMYFFIKKSMIQGVIE